MNVEETRLRRPARVVTAIEQVTITPKLKLIEPFTIEVDGFEVVGLDPPSTLSGLKNRVEKPHEVVRVLDSLGSAHYLWHGRNGDSSRVSYFTKPPFGRARVHQDWIPLVSKPPEGGEQVFRLNTSSVKGLVVGTVLTYNYAFARAWKQTGLGQWGVLAADGWAIPTERPDSRPRSIDNWPEYVKRLRKVYKTDADWQRLIAGLDGKFPEDLLPAGVPIWKALAPGENGSPGRSNPTGNRDSTAYCFDGSIPGFKFDDCDISVQAGVKWGETGHLAWVFRVAGKLAAIVVDKPIPESAAWVFLDMVAAEQLINPPVDKVLDWRERHAGLKERAIYYCPHLPGWENRLTLLLLSLLAEAGCKEAAALRDQLATKDGEHKRAAQHVKRILIESKKEDD